MSETIPPLGTLTDRVQLKQRLTTPEDEGGEVSVFAPLATVWARVRPLSSRQISEADARTVGASHSVVLRFRTDLSAGDRVVYRGRNLEVVAANDLNGRRAYLSCLCVERAVTG